MNTAERPTTSPTTSNASAWNERWGWGLIDAWPSISSSPDPERTYGTNPVPASWDNQNIGPVNFPPRCGVANEFFAVVNNLGPNRADNVRVTFGVYNFSGAAPPFIHVGTTVIGTLLPGATVTATVPWIPNCSTLSAHQCLKVEIGCDNDSNPLDNVAQRNLDITSSPVYFTVANYVTSAVGSPSSTLEDRPMDGACSYAAQCHAQ